MKWAWDKNNTYRLAEEVRDSRSKTWNVRTGDELPTLYSQLPLAIKPAVKENFFYATGAKAWRANTPEELHKMFDNAARQSSRKRS